MSRKPVLLFCLFASGGALASGAHWEYAGLHGPAHWAGMAQEFATCGLGAEQSPIDIRQVERRTDLPELAFDYPQAPLKIINNGHTIQVNLGEEGGTLKVGDHSYKLVQFHFHTPSEERIRGRAAPMVAHLVHADEAGKLAVVAVLIKPGSENAALKPVFDNMPIGTGPVHSVEGQGIKVGDLLPARHGYYHFTGSLTTPPCSEGVSWYVLNTPIDASPAQIGAFRRLYANNARPVQPLHGRKVVERVD